MRATFLGAILLGVIAGIAIVAVRNVPASSSGDAGSPGSETPTATATPDPADPQTVADDFAAAFEDQDAGAIYALLDSDSSFERTESNVRSDYEAFFSESTTTGLSVQQDAISRERATFQVTLRTAYFGELEYSISVPFTEEEGELRIDWTPSVIHPALRDGRDVRSEIRRPERGTVFDRNGTPLAQTVDRRILGLNRSIIEDRRRGYRQARRVWLCPRGRRQGLR
ncbi:MAG: NTF2-like N-terminal transpeptidase domain-containing protein [Dehalococcoidia bacterium]|nr:NTF2-like N-terminal transpeptidase domain-containing protein [Dehalococcoidia bacterium]